MARLVPGARALDKPLAYVFWAGVIAYVVWVTDGRLAAFAAIGFSSALGSLILLAVGRARPADLAGLPVAVKLFLRPALGFGVAIGVGIEVAGRWSGGQFVVWRGVVGGMAVLAVGLILVVRASFK